jgi:hypothetical protein
MNTYWGGALAAAAGCLVFGSLPRLRGAWRTRDALLLGLGLAIQVLTRPFESILLGLSVLVYFAVTMRGDFLASLRPFIRSTAIASFVVLPALGLIALHDKRVTGSWTTLPYALCRYQYGVPCAFTFQPNPVPHRQLTPEQETSYKVQSFVHGETTDTLAGFMMRLAGRVRYYRFFFLPPLYLTLAWFLRSLRDARYRFILLTLLIFFVGTNIYPYFYAHYLAGVTCLFLLATVVSLENLGRLTIKGHLVGPDAVRVIVFLCVAHFALWYGLQFASNQPFAQELGQYETWDEINHGDPDGRIGINSQLAAAPGKQLVFVRYWPKHQVTEWVYNSADIDRQTVVFARDLGAEENEKLRAYYPDRRSWLLEPDATPPKLSTYEQPAAVPPEIAPTQPAGEKPTTDSKKHPKLHFEEVK